MQRGCNLSTVEDIDHCSTQAEENGGVDKDDVRMVHNTHTDDEEQGPEESLVHLQDPLFTAAMAQLREEIEN